MKIKLFCKRTLWILLVILASVLMVWRFQTIFDNFSVDPALSFTDCTFLFWETLKELAALLPIWLLSLLGLVRSFRGENWFPYARLIPIHVTKRILAAAALLFVVITAAGAVYARFAEGPLGIPYELEIRLEAWSTTLAWILFYGILLYVEQWSDQRDCSRKEIRKRQAWVTVTIALMCLILMELFFVHLWYTPLDHVGGPNALEDHFLWWFSLYSAVFLLPFLFLCARKTVRLLRKENQWLTLSAILPKKITVSIVLAAAGLMLWQIRECRHWNELAATSDVPEHGLAAATGHGFQAMIWGLAAFYGICLLIRQLWAGRRQRSGCDT